eukprot:CAMPEP_0175061028 /NCGR_PEP_ID=MMETSP0052_2-20121109/13361_1 /TAXON_ID=51329 ORGANISM="Polytomella parva, Strain SAG 63-3" /NCGR_SAMPLE_ID=MMETSP0052_2 /ASSEMBLY_ACC=CAM_ASM_000194 /LENGTH=247 /DNA_ID=CAMNT_0016326845 /DNA_START=287 /DNA_END=1030 /DNA_ORIENTATION=-
MTVDDYAEAAVYGKWINSLPVNHTAIVLGNRDATADSVTSLKVLENSFNGSTLIHNEIIEVMGYRIFGSSYVPNYPDAFQPGDDVKPAVHWATYLPPDADVDIIVTHGPPFGFGDEVRRKGHLGDTELLRAVQALQKKPMLWICAHIHESHGVYSVPHPSGDIPLINVAVWELDKGVKSARPWVVQMPEAVISQPTEEEVMAELGKDFQSRAVGVRGEEEEEEERKEEGEKKEKGKQGEKQTIFIDV